MTAQSSLNITSHFDPEASRILVVDDEERMLTSLENLLIQKGYNVTTAQGGLRACQELSQGEFDLVMLDLNMKDMTGHEVMDYIAERGIDLSIIVVSGESSFSAVSKALRRGAYDYIRKPYDHDEMQNVVAKALRKVMLEKAHVTMQSKLKKSEELHRYIVNSSPDVVFMLNKSGHFTFLNKKVEALLGYEKNELLGQHYLNIVDPADADRANYIFSDKYRRQNSTWSTELRLLPSKKGHESRFFELTFFPIDSAARPVDGTKKFAGIYGTARDITERKEAEEFINFQAYHDLLTRLPNRVLFKDRLKHALSQASRNGGKVAVMFLDLDRFKIVNDTLGHAMGDRLLQSVALRLSNCVRKCDTLSRFGGDEFTLVLPGISSADDARIVAKKIVSVLKDPFVLAGQEAYVGVSIGIAISPNNGDNVEELIQNADVAMYHVKSRGKDGYSFFSEEMTVVDSDRLNMERDIRMALEREEFRVYYQPKVCGNSGKVIGVEALVRWHHPEKGLLYPGSFIPLAEETRLMPDINDWVLQTACREIGAWLNTGYDIKLAINFSPLQVEHPKFVENLLTVLKRENFPAQHLEIELTEEVIMKDLEQVSKKLNELSQHGISIAIDDFGTGYSSLNYLRKLPIHTLKVDQTFIRDIEDTGDQACIVNAIISMAHGLKLNIVAEGVETRRQLDYLTSLGCHEMQGFLFGQAQPANATLALIRDVEEANAPKEIALFAE